MHNKKLWLFIGISTKPRLSSLPYKHLCIHWNACTVSFIYSPGNSPGVVTPCMQSRPRGLADVVHQTAHHNDHSIASSANQCSPLPALLKAGHSIYHRRRKRGGGQGGTAPPPPTSGLGGTPCIGPPPQLGGFRSGKHHSKNTQMLFQISKKLWRLGLRPRPRLPEYCTKCSITQTFL